MNKNEFSAKKWLLIFLTSIVIGVILYLVMIKIIFKPDFMILPKVALDLIVNLGNPTLKLKAYIAVFALFAPFAVCILWFLMPNIKFDENYGNAKFAKESEFEKMRINSESGLVLGCLIKNKKMKFIRATQPLSTLIVAPPGRGKTSGIIIPNLLLVPNSSVVCDIKGELYEKTAGYREQVLKNEIQLFSPFSWENTLFFNPFDNSIVKNMEYIHIKKLAEQIASTIFVGEKGKENDHWVVSAKTMFVFFAEYFMQKDRHATLAQLAQAPKADYISYLNDEFIKEALIYDEDTNKYGEQDPNKDTFKIWLKQTSFDKSIDENTRNQARAYSKAADNEFASIKSTYDTFIKVFSNPQVANATSKMSFSFEDLRVKRITMYIVIQTEDMEVLAPLVRIFIETLTKKLMSGQECSDPHKFVYGYFDEFVRFGKMPFLLEAPALCRSYGFVPVFVTQSYEQIKKYYGEDDLGIIKSNSGYQTIFAMNSTKDAKEISELIGDFTREKTSISQGNLDFFKSNSSKSKEAYKLVTDQDIKNQSSDDLLVLVTGFLNRPIKAKVPYWFKNDEWKDISKYKVSTNKEQIKDEISTNETENKDEIGQETQEQKLKNLGIKID